MQPFVAPDGAELDVHMTSCFRRSVAHEGSLPCGFRTGRATRDAKRSLVLLITHRMRENLREEEVAAVGCAPPPTPSPLPTNGPDTNTGFVLLLNQTDSNKQTELWRVSIAHSSCFNVLLLTKAKQRDRGLWLKGVCMVNHSRPAASLSSLILFHRSVSYFTARPAPPPKPVYMADLRWPRVVHTHMPMDFFQRCSCSQCHF